MSRKRQKRSLEKRIVVYCEGQTEKYYVGGMRRWRHECDPGLVISVVPVDLKGGGYQAVLDMLKVAPDSNCVARIVLLDFDRYLQDEKEQERFAQIVKISKKSIKKSVPVVLVVSNKDFEYALCMHDPAYRQGNTTQFLLAEWCYKDLPAMKADEKIWDKAHQGERSHLVALRSLSKRAAIVENDLKIVAPGSDKPSPSPVKLTKVVFQEDIGAVRTSNLADLFKIAMLDGSYGDG